MEDLKLNIKIDDHLIVDLLVDNLAWSNLIALEIGKILHPEKPFGELSDLYRSQKAIFRKLLIQKIYEERGDISDIIDS